MVHAKRVRSIMACLEAASRPETGLEWSPLAMLHLRSPQFTRLAYRCSLDGPERPTERRASTSC
eukprot:5143827-Alexandrium_andersonii.AAC.1